MSRLFISHSSRDDDWALALEMWLVREGWSGPGDIFLDVDPERGIAAGDRWLEALEAAATRCEAVLFLVSEAWLSSKWCHDEYQLASNRSKKLFALLIGQVSLDKLPGGLTAQWQVVRLEGEPAERFVTVHPLTRHQSPVHIAEAALKSLKCGLDKAGIGAETFDLQADANGPFGRRAVYRGLEALEPEDAAVFFGRTADIVRGIDALRGLATRKPPRLMVVLGASGAGKSSFLRAGLWPRLLRDDSQWLPLRAVRAGRGGAIEGGEGLLAALEDVHRRFALSASRAGLRKSLASPKAFVDLLRLLRQAAARRALITEPPFPMPILCLDQGEELFGADAEVETATFLSLARGAAEANEALLLVTIRSDAYGLMQNSKAFQGIIPEVLSLGPVSQGEIGRVIREPAELLRRAIGPAAPVFDAAVVARLQAEVDGETDALPLLAFVLQRLMREHEAARTIGVAELEETGGVAAAIESEAEAALADAGFAADRASRREALRRLFIPRLARIDRESKAPQRRVGAQRELPSDLLPLAQALTKRRLLVAKIDARHVETTDAATLEVAHEALLRRWPTLADLLTADRDALLLLDGLVSAASDWRKADPDKKSDYLAHRGSRLADVQKLAERGGDWAREITPAQDYLAACQARETAEREEREARLRAERAAEVARLRKLAWGGFGLLVVAVGVIAYVLVLRREAQTRADEAERAFKASLRGTAELVRRVRDDLATGIVQRAAAKDLLVKARDDLQALEQVKTNAEADAVRVETDLAFAEVDASVDATRAEARLEADRARRVAQSYLDQDPADTGWAGRLADSFDKLGDLDAAHDADRAVDEYRQRLALLDHPGISIPGGRLQAERAVQEKIGSLLRDKGNLEGASAAFRSALLAATDFAAHGDVGDKGPPDAATGLSGIALSHADLATLLERETKPVRAGAEYCAALAIWDRLAIGDPSVWAFARDLTAREVEAVFLAAASVSAAPAESIAPEEGDATLQCLATAERQRPASDEALTARFGAERLLAQDAPRDDPSKLSLHVGHSLDAVRALVANHPERTELAVGEHVARAALVGPSATEASVGRDALLSDLDKVSGLIQAIHVPAFLPSEAVGFLIPDSATRRLSAGDVRDFTQDQLAIARNEIFARDGRYFRTATLTTYFYRYRWYRPEAWGIDQSAIEKSNVELLDSLEKHKDGGK